MCITFIAAAVAAAAGCMTGATRDQFQSIETSACWFRRRCQRQSARTHCWEYFQAAVEMHAIEKMLHDNISPFRA